MKALVAAYGTLLSRESLALTISHEAAREKRYVPVWIAGFQRLFNVRPPYYRGALPSREESALNLDPLEGARCNAAVFLASLDELALLDARECGYERVVVPLLSFETSQPFGQAFAYLAPASSPWIERDPGTLAPLPRDLEWARAGARELGAAFAREFERTTFLADGRSPLG